MARQLAPLLALVLLAGLLGGCGGAQGRPEGGKAAARFQETQQADGLAITLQIDPVKAGANQLVVQVDDHSIAAAEAQVIMASMGHGTVIPLERQAPGRFVATTAALDMPGPWLLRIQAIPAAGAARTAAFHLQIP